MNAATVIAFEKIQSGANTKRDELITEHLHLVTAIAAHVRKSVSVHIELDDLVHAGTMGLFDAATKYRAEKEVAFPTYAKHRIRGAILDSLRQLDWASRDMRKRYKQVEAVTRELTVQLKREPTEAEVASVLGLDARRWQSLMVDFRNMAAAAQQTRAERDEEQPLREAPCPPTQYPDQVFARAEMRRKLQSVVQTLPERHQQVIKLYYENELSMKEIGNTLGVNESRVSQIHKSALARMQSVLAGSGICSTTAFAA
ncbi:MAG: FliA/WhiG family RNA polymerase sigma factor [Acidobacteriaceae bacterium]|nr:FliA/WhiG family RNA polymerase sigma factor [Acidobacteriaceae bacterium]